jgi:hypothetical protein
MAASTSPETAKIDSGSDVRSHAQRCAVSFSGTGGDGGLASGCHARPSFFTRQWPEEGLRIRGAWRWLAKELRMLDLLTRALPNSSGLFDGNDKAEAERA